MFDSTMNNRFTIFLNTAGSGRILNVIDTRGGSPTIARPDVPVTAGALPLAI
jgi:hypothetical protein